MRIYVASSWRNEMQPAVVQALVARGHEVYDFRNHTDPRAPKPYVFAWTEIDETWESWSTRQYLEALNHRAAKDGFGSDMGGLVWCEACVLLLPCGRSAHIEAGWAKGAGRLLYVMLEPDAVVPELMYMMADGIFARFIELYAALERAQP